MDIVSYVIAGVVSLIASGSISIALTSRAELKRAARIFRSKLSARKGIDEKSLTISLAYVTSADVSTQWWDQQFAKLQISTQPKRVDRNEILNYRWGKAVEGHTRQVMASRAASLTAEHVDELDGINFVKESLERRNSDISRSFGGPDLSRSKPVGEGRYDLSLVIRGLAEKSAKLPELLKSEEFI